MRLQNESVAVPEGVCVVRLARSLAPRNWRLDFDCVFPMGRLYPQSA